MADYADSPVEEGTPVDAANGDDWQQRYKDLQADYTRKSQELSELSQYRQVVDDLQSEDPSRRNAAADYLGIAFEDDPGMQDDPAAALEQRIQQLEYSLSTRDQREQAAAAVERDIDFLDEGLGRLEKALGRELDEQEIQFLASNAIVNRADDGTPGVQAAIDAWVALEKSQQSRWAASKRTTATPVQGQEGEENKDRYLDHNSRVARMVEQFNANNR